jgi:hypothetical protein
VPPCAPQIVLRSRLFQVVRAKLPPLASCPLPFILRPDNPPGSVADHENDDDGTRTIGKGSKREFHSYHRETASSRSKPHVLSPVFSRAPTPNPTLTPLCFLCFLCFLLFKPSSSRFKPHVHSPVFSRAHPKLNPDSSLCPLLPSVQNPLLPVPNPTCSHRYFRVPIPKPNPDSFCFLCFLMFKPSFPRSNRSRFELC